VSTSGEGGHARAPITRRRHRHGDAVAVPSGAWPPPLPAERAGRAGPSQAHDRCEEAGGTSSRHRGIHSCVTTSERVEESQEREEREEVLRSEPGDLRATVRTTTVVTSGSRPPSGAPRASGGAWVPPARPRRSAPRSRCCAPTPRSSTGSPASLSQRASAARLTVAGDRRPPPTAEPASATPSARRRRSSTPDTAARCEFLDPTECLLVWPSDHLTEAGPHDRHGTPAGARPGSDCPRNIDGVAIDPTEPQPQGRRQAPALMIRDPRPRHRPWSGPAPRRSRGPSPLPRRPLADW
jgi:hypothetical protein